MPHYADGSQAQIGDKVKGKPYNTPSEIIGEVINITQGSDVCNCMVAFVKVVGVDQQIAPKLTCPYASTNDGYVALLASYDYGETRAFTKI